MAGHLSDRVWPLTKRPAPALAADRFGKPFWLGFVPSPSWIRRRVLEHLAKRRCSTATATSIWFEGGLRGVGVKLHEVAYHLEQMEAAGQVRRVDFVGWELAL